MPFDVNNLDNGVGVQYVSAGLITGKDFIATKIDLLVSEERLKRIRYLIYDLTRIDSLDFPFNDFKKLEDADRLVAAINPSLIIVLVVENDLALTLARMWVARTDEIPWDKQIVSVKSEAYSWVQDRVKERFGENIACEICE
jgi:hypothetical protein